MRERVESQLAHYEQLPTQEQARRSAFEGFGRGAEFQGSDRFLVQDRLGAGGFGVVYQVYDREQEAVVP